MLVNLVPNPVTRFFQIIYMGPWASLLLLTLSFCLQPEFILFIFIMVICIGVCTCVYVCVWGGVKLCLKFIKEHQTLCRFLIINLKHSKLCYQDLTMLSQIFKVCSFSLWYQFPLTEIYPNAGIKLPTDWHLRFLGLWRFRI